MKFTQGPRVRELREERDLFPQELADLLGISKGYLRNIENGNDSPSRRLRFRMARVLNAPELSPTSADYPDEPPPQPKNLPKGPPRRQDTERTTGPKRVNGEAA